MLDNQNDNNNNILVNLSFLILKKILSYLDENIDKISFSLVCQRFFNERNKYLIFNTKNLLVNSNNKSYVFKSYLQQYKNSLDLKNNFTLIVRPIFFEKSNDFDYTIDIRDFKLKPILPNQFINELLINNYHNNNSNNIYNLVQSHIDLKTIKSIIDNSNITKFSVDIHSIHFDDDLKHGVFSSRLKTLNLDMAHYPYYSSNGIPPLKAGVFPTYLVSLTLHYDFEITPGMLPSSLRSFRWFRNTDYPFQICSLPPFLEVLHFESNSSTTSTTTTASSYGSHSCYSLPLEEGILPQSLRTIHNISHIVSVRHLKSLKTLTMEISRDCHTTIQPKDIPEGVLNLTLIIKGFATPRIIPTTVTNLTIVGVDCWGDDAHGKQRNSLFYCKPSTSIKRLSIYFSFNIRILDFKLLPKDIQELELNGDLLNDFPFHELPSTVRQITISGKIYSKSRNASQSMVLGRLPEKVESVILDRFELESGDILSSLIGKSVRSITINSNFFIKNSMKNISTKIQSIKVVGKFKFIYEFRRLSSEYFILYISNQSTKSIFSRAFGGIIPSNNVDCFLKKK